ncbi:MAG: ABC transporter permease [Myxococcota bacterium]|jgi:peptide/nickel transport system permease protein|nr:ABC transporter permease [Myxococcota bacterium]
MSTQVANNSLGRRALQKLLRQKLTVICFVVIIIYLSIALLGALNLLPDFQARVGESYEPPSLSIAKIFGTDIFGRSVLFKLLAGTKTAISIGFLVTSIAVPIGITLGSLAGYYGGKIDGFVVWLFSVIVSVPYLLMVIAISYVLGKGMLSMCIAMGSIGWVGLCRLIRAEFLKHKEREYVLAARLLGANDYNLIFKQILPNVLHLAIITASLQVLGAIKSEVILTYLGVGVQDGSSWGSMISDATGELVNGHWWPLAGVVITMFFIIYALNVVGDALRDALDPKLVD